MEQNANTNLGISVPPRKKTIIGGADFPNSRAGSPQDGDLPHTFEHVGVPIRRVVARALAKARAHEIGLGPALADVSLLSRPKGRAR